MTVVLVVAHLAHLSGMPEDNAQNGFVGEDPVLTPAALALTMRAALTTFYNVASGAQDDPLAFYISAEYSRVANACFFKSYDITADLAGTPHGPPIVGSDASWTLGAASPGGPLPTEVSCVLSYHGALGAFAEEGAGGTRPRSRHRGRVYIGGLQAGSASTPGGPGGSAVPTTPLKTDLGIAADTLKDDASFSWVVWSRVNAAVDPIIGGWVDDRFDTQRRRGLRRSSRTLWS